MKLIVIGFESKQILFSSNYSTYIGDPVTYKSKFSIHKTRNHATTPGSTSPTNTRKH